MRTTWLPSTILAVLLAVGAASAQTPVPTTTPPPPAPGGAFDSLSPGNQKIALAIFDSQERAATTSPTKQLSLDQIAQQKLDGKGWGVIFKDMKGQVADKNLGQAVSRFARSHHGGSSAPSTEITTASGRTVVVGGREGSGAAASARHGSDSDGSRANGN